MGVAGEQADGTKINGNFTAKYDGKEYSVTGAPYDAITIKQVNAGSFTFTQKNKAGKYSVTGRTVISKDGKTMTNTFHGTNADGHAYTATMVYDKQ